jgi:RHS repeat-associated protein
MRPTGAVEYVLHDHLGSARITLDNAARVIESRSYTAFGDELTSSGTGARTSYIGRETDNESDLGFYGVRLYDPTYGRFLSTDPLWSKYLPLQSFQYAGNSPAMSYDENGKWIQAVGEKAQEAVRNSVPEKFRDFVVFNDGILDVGRIKEGAQGQDVSSNVAILSRLAENQSTIEVKVADEFDYLTLRGDDRGASFQELDRSTPGQINLGTTLVPRVDQKSADVSPNGMFSPSGNIQVIVRESGRVSDQPVGVTTAHELYGHARFVLLCRIGRAPLARHARAGELKPNVVDNACERAERDAKSK